MGQSAESVFGAGKDPVAEMRSREDMKLSEISEAVGMSSAQYLIHCFKNIYGVTPKKLRETSLFQRND